MAEHAYLPQPPSKVWIVLVWDEDEKMWDPDEFAFSRDHAEQMEADILRNDETARTLVREYGLALRHPKSAALSAREQKTGER